MNCLKHLETLGLQCFIATMPMNIFRQLAECFCTCCIPYPAVSFHTFSSGKCNTLCLSVVLWPGLCWITCWIMLVAYVYGFLPHTGQFGSLFMFTVRKLPAIRSITRSFPVSTRPLLRKSFRVSAACIEPITPGVGLATPIGFLRGEGLFGKAHL